MNSRFAPHRIRSRYLDALKATPIPVGLDRPPSVEQLLVLGTAEVAGCGLRLGTMPNSTMPNGAAPAPRLWVAFDRIAPPLLGYVTGLIVGEPDLWICEDAHRAWALHGANTAEVKRAAARAWFSTLNECEG